MKIQLPIDTSQVKFIAMALPEPVVDRATKQQRADSNGEPLYSMDLGCIVAKGVGKGGDVINVKLMGTPQAGIREGEPVKVTGLTITAPDGSMVIPIWGRRKKVASDQDI